jgi:hypothetical protein
VGPIVQNSPDVHSDVPANFGWVSFLMSMNRTTLIRLTTTLTINT